MTSHQPPESLLIRPEPQQWSKLVGLNQSEEARQFRRELGLPLDRPVIMTGHQAQFWHPGILAKYLAVDAGAQALGAAAAFLVVDQDRPGSALVRYPVVLDHGLLAVRTRIYSAAGTTESGAEGEVPEHVAAGLAALDTAWTKQNDQKTVAERIAWSVRELMLPLLSPVGRSAAMIFATQLARTTLFRRFVAQMAADPERCILAYNNAAARHAAAGIRPLEASAVQDRWELPLWHLPPREPRRHVFVEDVPDIPPEELAPKALLMTGLLRLAGCDLFIHGTGGGGVGAAAGRARDVNSGERESANANLDEARDEVGYDRITEEWFEGWLIPEVSSPGRSAGTAASLAPMAVVTATRYLPLPAGASDIPSEPEVARARWRAHHARHHPAAVGNADLQARRESLVAQIARARGPHRAQLFRQLHAMLDTYRQSTAPAIAKLAFAAESAAARQHNRAILQDRTWAFPLYPKVDLRELKQRVSEAMVATAASEQR